MSNFSQLCVFRNLKKLMLDGYLSSSIRICCRQVAAFIISAAPYLELLQLDLTSSKPSIWVREELELPSMFPHKNLKEVKLSSFSDDLAIMDFLAYLVECTVSLQKINLNSSGDLTTGGDRLIGDYIFQIAKNAERSKKCVMELRKILHTNVQLIYVNQYIL
ncbi:uncharacterized protein LOC110702971 isoform X2 [Chenopodium quinoa]|nr:uncharacterized protein LOC110702971 isoform X2 [Chenopodium quinoa]